MHIWPWFMKAPKAAAFTASCRSASASTRKGALPPSSSSTGLNRPAHCCAMMRPTWVEPVKLTRRTAGWAISAETTSAASAGALVTTLTTPAGRPASCRAAPINWCVRGQSSDALSTTVLPQASGMATARTPRITGAFHGAMPRHTPAGLRTAMARQPGLSDGIPSPPTCVVMDAASRRMPAARRTLKPAQPAVAPVSPAMASVKSAMRCSSASAARSSSRRRSVGPSAAQAGKAAAAASAARRASSADAAGACVTTSPVMGLQRSKRAPDRASASWPAISIWISMLVSFRL